MFTLKSRKSNYCLSLIIIDSTTEVAVNALITLITNLNLRTPTETPRWNLNLSLACTAQGSVMDVDGKDKFIEESLWLLHAAK